ncbi:MAG: IPT/TIG domain-containing protein [Myxococcota bacterium]|nr:IPT/TIG domain-containing protein [Myxococcota bacterium]
MSLRALLLQSILFLLPGCDRNPYARYWPDGGQGPVLSSVSPRSTDSLLPGGRLTLKGTRLGATQTVIIGGRNAVVRSATQTEVVVDMPAGPAGGGIVDVVLVTDEGFDRLEDAFAWRPPGAEAWAAEMASATFRRLDHAPDFWCSEVVRVGGVDEWVCGIDLTLVDGRGFIGPTGQPGLAAELAGPGRLADLPAAGEWVLLGPDDGAAAAPQVYGVHTSREAIGLTTPRDLDRDVRVLDELAADADALYPWSDAITGYEGPVADLYDDAGCYLGTADVMAASGTTLQVSGETRGAAGVALHTVGIEAYETEVYDNYILGATARVSRRGDGSLEAAESGILLGYDDWSGAYLPVNPVGQGGRADLPAGVPYDLWFRDRNGRVDLGSVSPVGLLTALSPDPREGLVLARDAPAEMVWSIDGDTTGIVVVEITVYAPEIDTHEGWFVARRLLMWADASDGTLTLPPAALEGLPMAAGDTDDNGDPVGYHAYLSLTRHGLFTAGLPAGGDLVIDVVHSVEGPIDLE